MALTQLWTLITVVAVVIIAAAIGVILGIRRGTPRGDAAPIARAERLRALPTFRRAVRRQAYALGGILIIAVLAAVLAGAIAARPMTSQTIQPVNTSRDIMLCLDVSGSMGDVDVEVLSVFDELLDGFEGERIGLTIFNSSPVQVFPLTDDYAFIRENLRSIRDSFDYVDQVPEHWVGTLNGSGASLIGDGLASCAVAFDQADQDRSRSIVLATDNEVNGAPLVTLEEATAYTASKGIRVFALNPVQGKDTDVSAELIRAAEQTGGAAYGLRETTTVGDILAEVQKQEATQLRGQAQIVWTDAPEVLIAILLVAMLGAVALLWRVRL